MLKDSWDYSRRIASSLRDRVRDRIGLVRDRARDEVRDSVGLFRDKDRDRDRYGSHDNVTN